MSDLIIGDVYGRLTVFERDIELENAMRLKHKAEHPNVRYTPHKQYKCRCECGNQITVDMYSLLRGMTTSCGCSRSKDLTGMIYNNLFVIGLSPDYKPSSGQHKRWLCRCLMCGSERTFKSSDITAGYAKDCGCGTPERISLGKTKDLMGEQFGHLKVLRRDMNAGCTGGKHARWICQCDICGSLESIPSYSLTVYGKDRCSDCIRTYCGEQKIREILDNYGIEYDMHKSMDGCVFPETNHRLFFDFVIYGDNGTYMVEYDGIQHFKDIPHWDTKINLSGRRKRDTFKNNWCAERGYKLIRIPYTHLKEIDYNDIKPDTSSFLVS